MTRDRQAPADLDKQLRYSEKKRQQHKNPEISPQLSTTGRSEAIALETLP
jgi:hypothetical protein